MKFVYLLALLAWGPDGKGTPDSGHYGDPTLSDCHARSQAFSRKHGTPLQLCVRVTEHAYRIIASTEVTFDFNGSPYKEVVDHEAEVERLRLALRAIGRLHVGKTRDSQKVRAIIRKATQ